MPNLNSLAMEPMGDIAGTASSFLGFYTTIVGALIGMAIGQAFDGTIFPLACGYLGLGSACIGVVNPQLVTSHSVAVGGLTSSTTYSYQVNSKDAAGNVTASLVQSFATSADTTLPTVSMSQPLDGAVG